MKTLLAALSAVALLLPATVSSASASDAHPAAIEHRVIGHSVKGRPIHAWRLGNPDSHRKVLLLAAMHGDETAAVRTLRALRDGKPITNTDIWVVPVVNPDGVKKHRRQNARGVDLNRNWSTGWKKQGGAVKSGRKAFSEPETRAIRKLADEVDPTYTISFHQPLDGIDVRDTGNRSWVKRLTKAVKLPKKAFDCFSACHGTYSMWFRKHHPKDGVITVELPKHPSKTYVTKTLPKAILTSVNARH